MKQVTLEEAKIHLSDLIEQALAGEEVVIAEGAKPLVRLTPLLEQKGRRRIGGASGLIKYMADDFDAPLDEFKDYME